LFEGPTTAAKLAYNKESDSYPREMSKHDFLHPWRHQSRGSQLRLAVDFCAGQKDNDWLRSTAEFLEARDSAGDQDLSITQRGRYMLRTVLLQNRPLGVTATLTAGSGARSPAVDAVFEDMAPPQPVSETASPRE